MISESVELERRHFRASDGTDYVVALDTRWFACLDWMLDWKRESLADIVDFCHRYVRDFPDESFVGAFEYYLHLYMQDHRRGYFGLTNDNLMPDERGLAEETV